MNASLYLRNSEINKKNSNRFYRLQTETQNKLHEIQSSQQPANTAETPIKSTNNWAQYVSTRINYAAYTCNELLALKVIATLISVRCAAGTRQLDSVLHKL